MLAITIPEPGAADALVVAEVPDPQPGAGEVRVRVAAAGVNRADVMQRMGRYPPPPSAPAYPGLEVSGVIDALGPQVSSWAIGDEVCALLSGGGYAQLVCVPAGQLLPVPEGISLRDAAALPEVACTVWSNVFLTANLQPAETILIHGGSSGIGTMAIQLAVALGALAASVVLAWVAVNLLIFARYIGDSRAQELPLLGGESWRRPPPGRGRASSSTIWAPRTSRAMSPHWPTAGASSLSVCRAARGVSSTWRRC